jgi:integrase
MVPDRAILDVRGSYFDGVEESPKTDPLRRPLPIPPQAGDALKARRKTHRTPYRQTGCSPPMSSVAKHPLLVGVFWSRSVVPTMERAGITTPKLVWHKRRRSFASLLVSTGRSLRVSMERVRHSTPDNDVGDHAQAIGDEKRNAGEKAASLDWKRAKWLSLLYGPLAVPFQLLTFLLDPGSRAK